MQQKTLVGSAILIFAGVIALVAMLVWQQASIHPASAASGCGDLDGNGTVGVIDLLLVSNHWNPNGNPTLYVKQADQNKDGVVDLINDILVVMNQFGTSTACQTNTPLPKTTPVGGALAVDADGESTSLSDTVETKRSVAVGGPFQVSVHVTSNPGTIVGYGLRLHWDEALLILNPRDAYANDRWGDNVGGYAVQALGPTDDGAGSEAYIELGAWYGTSGSLPDYPTWSGTGPTAQFEFTCQATGTANLTLTDAGSHSVLVGRPAIEYMPTLANAQINCLTGPTPTGIPPPPTDTPTPTPTPTPPPPEPAVLLVHGYGGSCGTFSNLEPWLEQALVDSGDFTDLATAQERVECFDPLGGGSGYDYSQGTWLSALGLSTYVQDFRNRMSPIRGDKIDIVAHSFGGLVSRFYIEVIGADFTVSSLTMLGTPNEGTKMANAAVAVDMSGGLIDALDGGLIDDWAAWDMRTASNNPGGLLHLLNDGFVMPSGTTYRAVAGTHSTWVYRWLDEPNDCVVPAESVEGPFPQVGIRRAVSHPGRCTLAPAYLTNDAPSPDCSTDPARVFCDVLAVLLQPSSPASAGDPQPVSLPGQAGAPAGPAPAGTGFLAGHAAPGSTNNHPVSVDASAASVLLSAFWEGSADSVRLTVERPDGTLADPGDPDVTYSAPGEISPGFFMEAYEIAAPAADQWVLRVEAVSVPADGQDYVVAGFFDSVITLALAPQPASVIVGEQLTLTATLEESSIGLTGATVDVNVVRPDGSSEVLVLTDDGAGPDTQANDGTYTATLTDTAMCGAYGLIAQAQGTASTGPFARADSAFVDARVLGSAVGDPCNADEDDDGCTDSVELGLDETLGGLRDPLNPWDFYDVDGLDGEPDGYIDLLFDILGVIDHWQPTAGGAPPYDVAFDRGPSAGPNPWNMTAPDGVIDLLNDILGVIEQFNHDCR